MSRCPLCNSEITTGSKVCTTCGLVLETPDKPTQPTTSQTPPPQVTCPKCGSTQIQIVPRKWSLMTGVITNKVDRVCVNCKCKF